MTVVEEEKKTPDMHVCVCVYVIFLWHTGDFTGLKINKYLV